MSEFDERIGAKKARYTDIRCREAINQGRLDSQAAGDIKWLIAMLKQDIETTQCWVDQGVKDFEKVVIENRRLRGALEKICFAEHSADRDNAIYEAKEALKEKE